MTLHYNKASQREKRRALRNNPTEADRSLWRRLQGKQLGVKFRRQFSVDAFIRFNQCIDGMVKDHRDKQMRKSPDVTAKEAVRLFDVWFQEFDDEKIRLERTQKMSRASEPPQTELSKDLAEAVMRLDL